ncbi:MAG TPA: 2-amino-4-hydroxy-6-hydroxymethyldihydropteridine diphosphokinase [Povalibacter sp.]|nr:2-amino-4-hydroxy-6-hydroxymethyldihydropteridine diphosphokinase [Povalibacter sp.]
MSALWTPAYIAIGSNQDDPQAQVRAAFESLAGLDRCRLVCRSRLYRTVPLGPQDQPDFVNAAAGLLTQLAPHELLVRLKELEKSIGRQSPVVRWGPRRIDFDLSVFGAERVNEVDLTIPHPGVPVRNFVLYPLADIAPDLLVPGHGRVRELAERVGRAGLTPIS